MKKLLALGAVAGAVLFAVKKNKASRREDELWRQATTPSQNGVAAGTSASVNGSAASTSKN